MGFRGFTVDKIVDVYACIKKFIMCLPLLRENIQCDSVSKFSDPFLIFLISNLISFVILLSYNFALRYRKSLYKELL